MNPDSWPFNLWEDMMKEAANLSSFQSTFQNDPSPVLYWPNVDDVLLQALTEREQVVIRMRYEQGMTYKSISDEVGVKIERVRQIVAHARRKLREPRYFNRLWAVPAREVFRCQTECRELARQNEQLKEQIVLLSKGTEAGKVEKRLQMPLNSPVDALDISMRSRNRLIANRIDTVGDLINCTEAKLKSIPNLGKASIENIKTALARYGYELKPDK